MLLVVVALPVQAQFTPAAAREGEYFHHLKGKRVSLVAHAASVSDGVHLVDRLKDFDVVSIMSPEHGFQSKEADGELVSDGQSDEGVPIISLYGSHKKPTAEDLANVDVVVFELQDLGLRFYTYISTLAYVMEACAENDVELIVLDRPNPFINHVDGPVLDTANCRSFIGLHPVPVAYGMTIGEYAQMVQGERWMNDMDQLTMHVVSCGNYHREPVYPSVPPSPNLPDDQSVAMYPSLCPLEAAEVSVGRGTDRPFQLMGSPSWQVELLGDHLVTFTPRTCQASKYPPFEDELCYGVVLEDVALPRAFTIQLVYDAYQQALGAGVGATFFNSRGFALRIGNYEVEEQLKAGWNIQEIEAQWKQEEAAFRDLIRSKYLMY